MHLAIPIRETRRVTLLWNAELNEQRPENALAVQNRSPHTIDNGAHLEE